MSQLSLYVPQASSKELRMPAGAAPSTTSTNAETSLKKGSSPSNVWISSSSRSGVRIRRSGRPYGSSSLREQSQQPRSCNSYFVTVAVPQANEESGNPGYLLEEISIRKDFDLARVRRALEPDDMDKTAHSPTIVFPRSTQRQNVSPKCGAKWGRAGRRHASANQSREGGAP